MRILRLLPLAALLLASLLLVGACADPAAPPPLSTAPPPLEMVLLANSDEVDVALHDPEPVVSARLIDAAGQEFPVGKITYARETEGQSAGIQPQLRMNAAGGSTGTTGAGVGLSLPLLGSTGPTADRVVVSYFSVRILDMAAYRASWQHWKFHVTLGATKSNRREIEFLPPRPPS